MMMISSIHSGRSRSERGFNLVEVLIAMALLGTVLMTILTLFYMGRRNVYSGKQTSVAVSIASHAMEDLSARSKLDVIFQQNGTISSASPVHYHTKTESGKEVAVLVLRTAAKIPKNQYTLYLQPNGSVQSVGSKY